MLRPPEKTEISVQADRKLRVLFISQYFWPEDFRANDIVLGLKERGCEVTVVTAFPNYPKGRFFENYNLTCGPYAERWNGIQVLRMPLIARGQSNPIRLALNYLSFAIFGSFLMPFRLKRSEYDVVLCWMVSPVTQVLPAIVAKIYAQAPLVLWVMDLWPDSLFASGLMKNKFVIAVAGRLTRWIYRRSDVILGQSRSFAEHISRVGGFPSQHVGYMPQWEPTQRRERHGTNPSMPPGFNVLFTGNIGFSQDFETVIAAADLLRSDSRIHWHIVGDGHALSDVRSQVEVRDLTKCVHIWGRYPSEAMSAFYEAADALLATLRAEEVFTRTIPTKVQAYLASGRPIITAIDGEVTEVIKTSGAGFAARAGDARSLAQAVRAMADLPRGERDEMGRRGKAYYAEQFDREMLLTRLLCVLREAIET